MSNICVCPKCGVCYEASSEESANEPLWMPYARWCGPCFKAREPDGSVTRRALERK
jgi:hypothetical protein